MDSSSTVASSKTQRLVALAQQLRLYKPPPPFDEMEEQQIQETAGKVVSQVGFQESVTPIIKDPERFRPKKAAVLICLFEGDAGDLRVILTKRSSRMSTHSGEISLPGGKAEEGDRDDGDTATREAKEEIGLDPSLVEVVTVLEPFLSKGDWGMMGYCILLPGLQGIRLVIEEPCENSCMTGNVAGALLFGFSSHFLSVQHLLRVVPVIGILSNKKAFTPTPNPAEVEEVFDAPLEMFIKDENRRDEEREWMGEKFLLHFFDYEYENKKYLIWGLTAGILIRAASVVYQKPPAFIEQNPKFKFPTVINKDTIVP
ncbi:Nudix hydrolase 15 [Citrus sinensis]|uniref:Nudix hydrolase 15 n=1 Tax=Citrus sinensis TaxID=2711 RepID=A0ACB8NI50_CITSI|nr:Nudix hydrolase 15 [Citrus sinensis]